MKEASPVTNLSGSMIRFVAPRRAKKYLLFSTPNKMWYFVMPYRPETAISNSKTRLIHLLLFSKDSWSFNKRKNQHWFDSVVAHLNAGIICYWNIIFGDNAFAHRIIFPSTSRFSSPSMVAKGSNLSLSFDVIT